MGDWTTGKIFFGCNYCDYRATNTDKMKRHLNKKHDKDYQVGKSRKQKMCEDPHYQGY